MIRQVLKFAMTLSIIARILLTCLLNSFSQSRSSRPCGFLIGVIIPLPTYPLSAIQSAGSKVRRTPDSLRQWLSCRLPSMGSEIQLFGKGAGNLDVQAGGLVLAGVSLRVSGPRPAREQGPVDEVLASFVQVLGGGNVRREHFLDERRDDRYRAADCRLRSPVCFGQLFLHPVPAHVSQGYHNRIEQPERRRPFLIARSGLSRVHQRAEFHDLVPGKSCGMIHGRLVSLGLDSTPKSFRETSLFSRRRTEPCTFKSTIPQPL